MSRPAPTPGPARASRSEGAPADGGSTAGTAADAPTTDATPAGRGSTATGDGGSWRATAGRRLRAWRFWLVVAVIAVVAVAVTVALRGVGADRGSLSPDNPAPGGARAAAQILRGQGVTVDRADDLPQALDRAAGAGPAGTLLLDDRSGILSAEQLTRLADRTRDAGTRVVLLQPGLRVLTAFADDVTLGGVVSDASTDRALSADCAVPAVRAAREVDRTGRLYRGPVTCLRNTGGDTTGQAAGVYVESARGRVVVLGGTDTLSNDRLAARGNAALMLHTLGARPTLTWYQPGVRDLQASDRGRTLADVTPPWVTPLAVWLLVVAVLAMLWRGRRDGPLVTEPLPVVVQAAETTRGRARLYQDADAAEHAAATLRAATLVRLGERLRLGHAPTADAIVAATAAATGRAVPDVAHLLTGPLPTRTADLLSFTTALTDLEKEAFPR
ncbi:hypothetical protein GCM10011512_13200 [Tersicoccus solisilvae]|uniref:DUF4350 domain-containing protein n=1 Tax=Tersicoccus solisilvae TaxID=1882339 RepID=A0ABQ1NYY8_9MICC|nr:DUF4350 domain-containing protein [Tersicoccus solisilvae]GGC87607.1 hypothetical protein GCM10011512_13200 [Tersicoccus solisilvae]